MSPRPKKISATPQLLLGILVVVAGVLFTLDNLNLIRADDFLQFWPLGLILVGFSHYRLRSQSGQLSGLLLVAAGCVLLARNLLFPQVGLFPVILVIVGTGLAGQALFRKSREDVPVEHDEQGSRVYATALLGGVERRVISNDFRGGELTAFMGGCQIDLTRSVIAAHNAVINVFVLMGGIELRVPEDWTVSLEGLPVMGGYSDRTIATSKDHTQNLVVRGTIIMGGLDVRN